MDTIQQGSAKVTFRVALTEPDGDVVDLTNLLASTFVFLSPSEARTARPGQVDGAPTLGRLKYVSASGEFDEVGRWRVQAEVLFADGAEFKSAVGKFKVKANL